MFINRTSQHHDQNITTASPHITETSPKHHRRRAETSATQSPRHHWDTPETSPTHHLKIAKTSLAHAENILTHHQRITETSRRYRRNIQETQTKHNRDITKASPRHHWDNSNIMETSLTQTGDITETSPRHDRGILGEYFSWCMCGARPPYPCNTPSVLPLGKYLLDILDPLLCYKYLDKCVYIVHLCTPCITSIMSMLVYIKDLAGMGLHVESVGSCPLILCKSCWCISPQDRLRASWLKS